MNELADGNVDEVRLALEDAAQRAPERGDVDDGVCREEEPTTGFDSERLHAIALEPVQDRFGRNVPAVDAPIRREGNSRKNGCCGHSDFLSVVVSAKLLRLADMMSGVLNASNAIDG